MSEAHTPILAADGPRISAGPTDVAKPFVKWVGGKRQLLPEILALMPARAETYCEPFVGGGAVFFALYAEGRIGTARLADRNLRLVRTWRAIQSDVDGVCERLDAFRAAHCKDHYYEVRQLDVDAFDADADVAAWFIYLNKTGFNGLYRVNRSGGFNVPVGRHKSPRVLDEPNLRAAHRALQCAEILHLDFQEACVDLRRGDAVYFDPPYVPLTPTANFTSYTAAGFDGDDQRRLADFAHELKAQGVAVVLSNHDDDNLKALYTPGFRSKIVKARRSVNRDGDKRGTVDEVLIW
ncbi:MAG: DNA adenine methylase [Alphaproteobacteria bacterium]|nr:DNA adenine methylase [Alphaproteobacteria bacterium]